MNLTHAAAFIANHHHWDMGIIMAMIGMGANEIAGITFNLVNQPRAAQKFEGAVYGWWLCRASIFFADTDNVIGF